MTKRSLILMFPILILALAAAGCGGDESKAATKEETATALPDDVAKVAEATTSSAPAGETTTIAVADTFEATGEFLSPLRSELSPKMPGRVGRMFVDEGSRVHRGQPVLELESDYARLHLQAAEAEVARAQAMRDEASRDLDRKKGLAAKDSIPHATLDRAQAAFDQAEAMLDGAKAQVALLRRQIADSTLRSPVDGIVAEKRTDVGARLGEAGVAFVFMQLSPLKLRFQVPERYLGRVGVGDTVTARVDPYPNETFTGRIKTVGGVIDPKSRTMFAEAEFPNRDGRLKPGLFARVETKIE
jgi:membrane fusion protein (multidrug efflux system)